MLDLAGGDIPLNDQLCSRVHGFERAEEVQAAEMRLGEHKIATAGRRGWEQHLLAWFAGLFHSEKIA